MFDKKNFDAICDFGNIANVFTSVTNQFEKLNDELRSQFSKNNHDDTQIPIKEKNPIKEKKDIIIDCEWTEV